MIDLKPIQESDKDFFLETYNDDETLNNMESLIKVKPEWFPHIMNSPNSLWMTIQKDKSNVGLFNSFIKKDNIHFGIIVQKENRRQGVARKAIKKYLEFMDRDKVTSFLECFSDNPAINLYKELGYKQMREYRTIRNRKFIKMKRKLK